MTNKTSKEVFEAPVIKTEEVIEFFEDLQDSYPNAPNVEHIVVTDEKMQEIANNFFENLGEFDWDYHDYTDIRARTILGVFDLPMPEEMQ